jgi:UDP-glucose 4-epimerase
VDNLSSGKESNLDWKQPDHELEFHRGDINDSQLMEKLIEGADWVFHEAAMPSVPRSINEPVTSNDDNLTGTVRLLDLSARAGVQRFLFASSSAIYGDQPQEPKTEDLPPMPITPYGLQKYASEKYGQMFYEFHKLPTVGLRYFNVFGPRQAFDSPYSGVIAKFCTVVLEGGTPRVFGDGMQTRDFTYIENVVAANIAAAEAPAPQVAGRYFNVATGSSISLLDLLEELGNITGRTIEPEFMPPRAGDIKKSSADISRAIQAFDLKTHVPWREGLRRTFNWYKESMVEPAGAI